MVTEKITNAFALICPAVQIKLACPSKSELMKQFSQSYEKRAVAKKGLNQRVEA